MFKRLWGRKEAHPVGDPHAVEALHLLDAAIQKVHPSRFADDLVMALHVSEPRAMANAFLGRKGEGRAASPLSYDLLVERFYDYAQRELLDEVMTRAESDATAYALMRGIWHEFKLKHVMRERHDNKNLGLEVQKATKTLIQFLNEGVRR